MLPVVGTFGPIAWVVASATKVPKGIQSPKGGGAPGQLHLYGAPLGVQWTGDLKLPGTSLVEKSTTVSWASPQPSRKDQGISGRYEGATNLEAPNIDR
jgi:hypothetical protein